MGFDFWRAPGGFALEFPLESPNIILSIIYIGLFIWALWLRFSDFRKMDRKAWLLFGLCLILLFPTRSLLVLYRQRFGEPPVVPGNPPQARQPTAQEIYDELKLPDDQLSGAYANGVMIGHTPSEFKFDFLTNLFPTSAVSARVFLSVPQVPRLLQSLQSTYNQFLQRVQQQRGQQNPPPSP